MGTELSVIIPAYNEEDSVLQTFREINDELILLGISYEIVFVDDGSSDKTYERLLQLKDAKIIQHPQNKGYGAALKTGIKGADGTYILITDADGTYPHYEIKKIWQYASKYDMVVGARIGDNVSVQLYRRPAKLFLTKFASYLSGYNIPDLNSGFRIFKKDDAMRFFKIICDGFSFTTTITLAYLANNMNIKYVPTNYYARVGNSKIKPFNDGLNFILLILNATTYFNPLKVFLPIAIIFFLAAIGFFLYSVIFQGQFMNVTTTILGVAAIQTGLFGLLADLIVKRSM